MKTRRESPKNFPGFYQSVKELEMHTHLINDNRDERGNLGSPFWDGRWHWWKNAGDAPSQSTEIALEWAFGKHAKSSTALYMKTQLVFEHECLFHIALWHLFSIFVGITLPSLPNWSYSHGDRTIGFRIFDGALWLDLWINDDEWRSKDPFWKKTICIRPMDIVFGRAKHSSDQERAPILDTVVKMPEGEYQATVILYTSTWKRPRGWWTKVIRRAEIEIPKGIPVPGKGENSWDLDDDAIFGLTCPATTVEEAVQAVIESANRSREKYGGKSWLPG